MYIIPVSLFYIFLAFVCCIGKKIKIILIVFIKKFFQKVGFRVHSLHQFLIIIHITPIVFRE